MRRDAPAFNKWDPDGDEARARAYARAVVAGEDEPAAEERARQAVEGGPDPLAGKRWLLRWAWTISTLFMAIGYVIMVLILTGHGDRFGL